MFSALKKWAKGGNEDSKISTPMGVRAMGQALQRKFARGVQYNMKIVIKGDRNTGKSCLFQRLQGKPFNEQYIPTNEIQVASIHWNYRTTDDVVKVEVWDVVDKGRSKKSSLSGLKLENDKSEGEKDGNVLDAQFVDVYKGAHGVLMIMDITKPWTFKYIERELPKVPPHIPALVLANHRDMGEHRLVQTEEAVSFIEHLERPDRSPPVHYAETSMKNGFGLKYIHKFLNLPFLLLQRETLLKQLQVNAEDTESTLEELQIHKETEEQNYDKFVSLLDKRRKDHEAKKAAAAEAAAAAAAAAAGDGEQSLSPASPSSDLSVKSPNSNVSNEEGSQKDRVLGRRTLSATDAGHEGETHRNGWSHQPANIDEFVPEDELDAEFLDEDKGANKKRPNKSSTKTQPAQVVVEPDTSEESDSEERNPMVEGFAEDIDSENDSVNHVVTNNIDEDLARNETTNKSKKPTATVTVDLTSSEEEDIKGKSDEEEKIIKGENEKSKGKKGKEVEKNRVKLKLEMPVNSASAMEPVEDGLGFGTEDVDEWLNSPDIDPKIPFRKSPADKEYTVRKIDTGSQDSSTSSAPLIPVDEWERFMTLQMKPQTKTTLTSPSSLIDIGFGDDVNATQDAEGKSRRKKEHRSGEKSKTKHKPRKHKDRDEEGEGEKKERRKSRHKDGDEGKDRRKRRDDESDGKKKHRSKHSRARSEEGAQDNVTYEEL